jgi:hypothetical protein
MYELATSSSVIAYSCWSCGNLLITLKKRCRFGIRRQLLPMHKTITTDEGLTRKFGSGCLGVDLIGSFCLGRRSVS